MQRQKNWMHTVSRTCTVRGRTGEQAEGHVPNRLTPTRVQDAAGGWDQLEDPCAREKE